MYIIVHRVKIKLIIINKYYYDFNKKIILLTMYKHKNIKTNGANKL
jgi:hypothetical protein